MTGLSEFLTIKKEVDSFLSEGDEIEVLNRLLLIECKHNLNLINCLTKQIKQQDLEILEVINLLEYDVLRLFLSDKVKSVSIVRKLIHLWKEKDNSETDDIVSNIIVKIKILKSIQSLSFENKTGYKNFRLRTRLDNLKKELNFLRIGLEKELN